MNDSFERDLRAVLGARAPAELPRSLQGAVARLDPAAGRGLRARLALPHMPSFVLPSARTASASLAIALAVAVLGAGVLHYLIRPPSSPGSGAPPAISWQTDVVSLEAEAIVIEAGGRVFSASADRFSVRSDPGTPTYRTLEVGWIEQGLEMRFYLYLAANETHWWVSELRTRDGLAQSDWIIYRGPLFTTPLGEEFTGDVDLAGGGGRVPGSLHIENLRLLAFMPGSGPRPFEDCTFLEEQPGRTDGRDPEGPMGSMVGLETAEAHAQLTDGGICHEFRLVWMLSDYPNQGSGQVWCVPPPGVVESTALGIQGELLLSVAESEPRAFDPNMPAYVGCQ